MTQFCIDCGAELRANVKFCTKCGATAQGDAAFAKQQVDPVAADSATFFERYLTHIIGGILAVGLMLTAGIYFANKPAIGSDPCADATTARPAACDAVAGHIITGQPEQMFIIADANVRDRPTAQGSNILQKMLRGTSVSGIMQIGEDGTSQWFKLDGDAGFIGAVNLWVTAPPKLAKTFADMKWNVEVETDLLSAPAEGSTVVGHLKSSDQTTIAGMTENGFAEVKRSKGGVGYFLATDQNDRSGRLRGSAPTGKLAASQDISSYCSANPASEPPIESITASAQKAINSAYDRTQKDGSSSKDDYVEIVIRCKSSRVLACYAANGAGGLKCIQSDTSRAATPDMTQACRDDPQMPLFSYARYSVWDWQCENGKPTIKGQLLPITGDGYITEEWLDITGALQNS